MKTVKFLLITITFLFSNISYIQAQNSEGTDFWLTFGKTEIGGNCSLYGGSSPNVHLKIRIVGGNQPTTGTINFTQLNTSVPFSIDEYEIYDYILDPTQSCAALNMTEGISHYSINIKTSSPVTVYATNRYSSYSNDVTNVLPVAALGREYYQISYIPSPYPALYLVGVDAYAVVATQNNTQIFHNDTLKVTLNEGEVYYKTSSTDMTGAHIISTYPIAFFAVNSLTRIPYAQAGPGSLFQQLSPVNTWGKTFFVPVTNSTKDIVRIVASQNNTTITQKGGTIQTGVSGAQNTLDNPLQARQFVELEVYLDSAGCYIQADKPVGVCTYIKSNYDGSYGGPPPVMPVQCWVSGIEQTVYKAFMSPFLIFSGATPLGNNYALVVTPTANRDNTKVSIDGGLATELSGGSWYDNADADISFYSMPLTEHYSTYTFSNSKGIIIFGYNNGFYNMPSSYYYLAYSAMRDLQAAFYANDIHCGDLENNQICKKEVSFRAEIENIGVEVDSIKWFIDGEEFEPAQNQETWSNTFITQGNYEITLVVYYFENGETKTKTITGTLKRKDLWVKMRNVKH